jgi:hypothetical protein
VCWVCILQINESLDGEEWYYNIMREIKYNIIPSTYSSIVDRSPGLEWFVIIGAVGKPRLFKILLCAD